MTYSSRISISANGKSYFAEITIGLKSRRGNSPLEIAIKNPNSIEWKTSIEFGIEYAWNKAGSPFGLIVDVLDVHAQVADTTPIMLAYVAANALWKGLGFAPASPIAIDLQQGGFFFPR